MNDRATAARARTEEPESTTLLEGLTNLSHEQLDIQLAAADNIDLKAIGLLGFLGALIAVEVAEQDRLGTLWWIALPGLALAVLAALMASLPRDFDAGPRPNDFYASYGGDAPPAALRQLLADLTQSAERNVQPLRDKYLALALSAGAALVTIAYSLVVLAIAN